MSTIVNPVCEPSIVVRKRTELNFTPSSPITISSSTSTAGIADSELSTSPVKKSGIPMPINGQISLRKEANQTTNGSSGGKMQQPQQDTAVLRIGDVNGDEDPLCEDILSCISALDEVIAEFDDPISLTSPPPPEPFESAPYAAANPSTQFGTKSLTTSAQTHKTHEQTHNRTGVSHPRLHHGTDPATQNPKPTFSRLITTLSTHPQEPSVTIMQKESQTVTKIQIGSGQVSKASSPSPSCTTSSPASSYVTSSPTSSAVKGAVSFVSWKNLQVTASQNNNSVAPVPTQHYSKRQQVQPQPPPIKPQVVVQLKQSDFTPGAPTRESCSSAYKGSSTSTLADNQDSEVEPRAVFKNTFTNYELIFPKSPNLGPRASKTGQSAPVKRFPADIIITPHNFNKQNNNNFASEVVVGAHASQVNGSSYPKIKQRQDLNGNSNVMESQSVKVRQSSNSPAASALYKAIPASFANNNIVIVEAKDKTMQQDDGLKEHWSFLSDENLPRSLRKTRKVILDEDEEGNTKDIEPNASANQINPCTAAVRKVDQVDNKPVVDEIVTVAVAAPVRNQKKQKLNPNASESENKKLRQQQHVLKKGIDQQSPRHSQNKNLQQSQSEINANKQRNAKAIVNHANNKNTYSKESGQSNRKTILSNFMFFPLSGVPSPEDEIGCEQGEAVINKINNNVQQQQQQGGNVKSQINSKPTKNNAASSAVARGPNALPANVAQLDVDDGYLSMINRHDPPIIWPETYIESETFTPEELKRLSSMKKQQHQPQHVNGRASKLISSLTTSEEKTDYFSDDSLENEQVDEAENLHLSYVIATHDVDMNGHRIQTNGKPPAVAEEKAHYELDNVRNVWRKSTSSLSESSSTPSSPVKKPLAFFIPLADSDPSKEKKESSAKTNASANGDDTAALPSTKEEKISQVKPAVKAEPLAVAPVVNAILDSVLRVGIQEASAINYLLSSAAPDYDDEIPRKTAEPHRKAESVNSGAMSEEIPLIEPPTLPTDTVPLEYGSSNEIFEASQEYFPVRTSQYEADVEDDDEVPVPAREASPTKDSEKLKKKRKSKTPKNQEDWNQQEMEFVEDFDQPPPFIPAPPPVTVKTAAHNVPKTTAEPVVVVRHKDQNDGHLNEHIKPHRASSPLPLSSSAQVHSTKGSTEHIYKNGAEERNKDLFVKSYHRSVDPDADYRMKMQRQASRSHENLLDIRSRQRDFLTPRRSQGQACTLPPNTVPPLNQRRHSTFRQFLGGIFKRSKKSDASSSGDVPDSPFEDIQFSFGRKNNFPALVETTPNANHVNNLPYNERKLFTNSPHGSQRSTRSTPVKRGLLSRIFHRKDK